MYIFKTTNRCAKSSRFLSKGKATKMWFVCWKNNINSFKMGLRPVSARTLIIRATTTAPSHCQCEGRITHNLNTKSPCLLLSDSSSRLSETVQTLKGVRFPHGGDGREDMGDRRGTLLLLSSNFLLPGLHPPQSSWLWGRMIGVQGLSHPVWGCLNSILIFPNCCLYQVHSLWLNTELWTADRHFLSKTRIVGIRLCYQEPPSCHILWLSTVFWCSQSQSSFK